MMQVSDGEAETDTMFVNRPAARNSTFAAVTGSRGPGGRSKGTLALVVVLIVAGIFGG